MSSHSWLVHIAVWRLLLCFVERDAVEQDDNIKVLEESRSRVFVLRPTAHVQHDELLRGGTLRLFEL